MLIEAAVESVDAARAAVVGGAGRLELCADLAQDGLTPTLPLLRECLAAVTIPVFVLVRPRAGDFVYSGAEHRTMLEQIREAKAAGARGIVSGVLTNSLRVDENRTTELIAAARPLAFTFHRAFDACVDLSQALETLIRHGVDRVLTSGGARTAALGAARIGQLVIQAMGRIVILPGGGINPSNVADLVRETAARELHFSVRDVEKVRGVIANAQD